MDTTKPEQRELNGTGMRDGPTNNTDRDNVNWWVTWEATLDEMSPKGGCHLKRDGSHPNEAV